MIFKEDKLTIVLSDYYLFNLFITKSLFMIKVFYYLYNHNV
jgi:hypothetical protein